MSSFKVDTLAEVTILHVKDVLSFVAKREENIHLVIDLCEPVLGLHTLSESRVDMTK
ncbi:22917_t:CDS:2 [Rhizophagus irregularis]|nr:22917_t:CDS:2 [Rhizophagus irregularis]